MYAYHVYVIRIKREGKERGEKKKPLGKNLTIVLFCSSAPPPLLFAPLKLLITHFYQILSVRANENLSLNSLRVQLSVANVISRHECRHELVTCQHNRWHIQCMACGLPNSWEHVRSSLLPPGSLILADDKVKIGTVEVLVPIFLRDIEDFSRTEDAVDFVDGGRDNFRKLGHRNKLNVEPLDKVKEGEVCSLLDTIQVMFDGGLHVRWN